MTRDHQCPKLPLSDNKSPESEVPVSNETVVQILLSGVYQGRPLMHVEINKIPKYEVPEDFAQYVQSTLDQAMDRYEDQLTRVEVHFGDTNAGKAGPDDKRCSLEARVSGYQPVAAVHQAETYELALSGAVDKLMANLEHTLGRLDR